MIFGGELTGRDDHQMRFFAKNECPNEADLLRYLQHEAKNGVRGRIERHLAGCDECRESVALMAYLRQEPATEQESTSLHMLAGVEQLSDTSVKDQTASVLAMIANDERQNPSRIIPLRSGKARPGSRWLPAPAFALAATLVVAFIGWAVYTTVQKSPAEKAMIALNKAVENGRHTELVVSRLDYARLNPAARGRTGLRGPSSDNREIEAALAEVRNPQSAEEKHVRARSLISGGQPSDIGEGLALLGELARTAEVLNDMGVAHFAAGDYELARNSFSEALKLDPDMPHAVFNHARTLYHLSARPGADQSQLRAQALEEMERFAGLTVDPDWKIEAKAEIDRMRQP
jgi:Flp pilus assembly protein TadD